MKWGIKTKKYLENGHKCKYYGDKVCPCVKDNNSRKKYDTKNGYWAIGDPLPDCSGCSMYVEVDTSIAIPISFENKTLIEREISLAQYRKARLEKKEAKDKEKTKKNTPIHVELLNASGGTAGERLSKAIIGGVLFGSIGAIIGFLGRNESNVKLIFKVSYADGSTKVVVKKANSKKAEELFSLMK